MHIDSYSFGSMAVDGRDYTNDLILFPQKVEKDWYRKQGHSLCLEDLDTVLEYGPEVLVVGRGAYGAMEIPEDTKREIKKRGIELRAGKTGNACELFNRLSKQGKKVVGAFHLTC